MAEKQPEVFKTEDQLREEVAKKREQDAKLAAEKPRSAGQAKRENFWYHYKWHSIAAVFVTALLVVFIKDMFFRPKPDATIVMVSSSYIAPEAVDELCASIESRIEDFNGDKKIIVSIDSISLPSDDNNDMAQGEQTYANNMKLVTVIAAGVDPIYLLDQESYEYLRAMSNQGNEASVADNIFQPDFVPAFNLGIPEFENMSFYIRPIIGKDNKYHEYCESMLKILDRS